MAEEEPPNQPMQLIIRDAAQSAVSSLCLLSLLAADWQVACACDSRWRRESDAVSSKGQSPLPA